MSKVKQKELTLKVGDDIHPLNVRVVISHERAQDEHGNDILAWRIEKLVWVEVVICDKEGIDITKQIGQNPRAMALLMASAATCDDQVQEELAGEEEVNHQLNHAA